MKEREYFLFRSLMAGENLTIGFDEYTYPAAGLVFTGTLDTDRDIRGTLEWRHFARTVRRDHPGVDFTPLDWILQAPISFIPQ